jgi:stage V sporulation protein R
VLSDHETQELGRAIEEIWEIGRRLGLDPFPTHFEVVPAAIMYEFGAYGLPGRFSHWTHGKAYHQMKMMYDYGLSKIYELVINTNPCYGFLMETNSMVQNKLVIAHVMGHCDFFKNNVYFGHTSRQMIETASVNADRIRSYEFDHGEREVEEFLDAVLAIQEHIDPHVHLRQPPTDNGDERGRRRRQPEGPYDDLWKLEERGKPAPSEEERGRRRLPEQSEKDILGFLMAHAPELEEWQRDVIGIVREEMLYFLPQMQTKIMNEGWASFWHARILRELELTDDEYVEFSQLNAGVLSPSPSKRSINPYYVGIKVWEDILRRWDNPTEEERRLLGREPNQGLAKIFEVRELENDVSFLRNYLTADLVEELDLYVYELQDDEWVIVEKDWEKTRDMLVQSMTNMGYPVLHVEDGDYRGNRELYLRHAFEGRELDIAYAEKAMQHVYKLWGRAVHLETVVDNEPVLMTYDGHENSARTLT